MGFYGRVYSVKPLDAEPGAAAGMEYSRFPGPFSARQTRQWNRGFRLLRLSGRENGNHAFSESPRRNPAAWDGHTDSGTEGHDRIRFQDRTGKPKKKTRPDSGSSRAVYSRAAYRESWDSAFKRDHGTGSTAGKGKTVSRVLTPCVLKMTAAGVNSLRGIAER